VDLSGGRSATGRAVFGWRRRSLVSPGGGEHDAGVPELVLDGLEVGAGGVGEAGGALAEVVEADRRQVGGVGEFPEPLGDGVRAEWGAVAAGEHVAGLLPGVSCAQMVEALPAGVLAQHLDGVLVERDDAVAGSALRR